MRTSILLKLRRFLLCRLLDMPARPFPIRWRPTPRADIYDEFGRCARCNGLLHRDTHIYADTKWRHYRGDTE